MPRPKAGSPTGALPILVTGGVATHQNQASVLPLGLGQGTLTHRSLQPGSRDSPGQLLSPGLLTAAAAEGGARPEVDVHCLPWSRQPNQGVLPQPPQRTQRAGSSHVCSSKLLLLNSMARRFCQDSHGPARICSNVVLIKSIS